MKPALILATVALLIFAWMFRYEVIMGGPGLIVLKLDRWTGSLYLLNPEAGWERIDAPQPEPEAVDLLQKPAAK